MKLNEVKEFVKELRGLSQEELAKRDREYKGPSSVIYDATARLFTG